MLVADGVSLPESQNSSVWNSTYPSHPGTCLPSVSVSVHPDFSPSPISLNHTDGALWAGHVLSQASLTPLASLPDSWTYSLNSQSTSGYPNVHDVRHPHPHVHIRNRHHHPMFHSYQPHSAALDSRFSPLLLPGVRSQSQTATSTCSSPHSEVTKTEMDPGSNSPITASSFTWTPSPLHGSLELYDSGRYGKALQHLSNTCTLTCTISGNNDNNHCPFSLSLQLLIRPKQSHQFGSNGCIEAQKEYY